MYINQNDNVIPNDYIAVFKGGTAETVHTTYVSKTKKQKKITYKYINTISKTDNYDSTTWNEEIIKN